MVAADAGERSRRWHPSGRHWSMLRSCENYGQNSGFAIAEVVVWPRSLTSEEMRGVSEHLMNRMG